MGSTLKKEKKRLYQVIFGMAKEPSFLVVRPGNDFTRHRYIPLETVLSAMVSIGDLFFSEIVATFHFPWYLPYYYCQNLMNAFMRREKLCYNL